MFYEHSLYVKHFCNIYSVVNLTFYKESYGIDFISFPKPVDIIKMLKTSTIHRGRGSTETNDARNLVI